MTTPRITLHQLAKLASAIDRHNRVHVWVELDRVPILHLCDPKLHRVCRSAHVGLFDGSAGAGLLLEAIEAQVEKLWRQRPAVALGERGV